VHLLQIHLLSDVSFIFGFSIKDIPINKYFLFCSFINWFPPLLIWNILKLSNLEICIPSVIYELSGLALQVKGINIIGSSLLGEIVSLTSEGSFDNNDLRLSNKSLNK